MTDNHWQIPLSDGNVISVFYYPSIDSTNKRAIELARQGTPEWTVVFASRQTAGKGRYERVWWSPPDLGLWFSIILRPRIPARFINLVNLASAIGMRGFIQNRITEEKGSDNPVVLLKWPNDIIVDGKKLCGILLESDITAKQIDYIVVGIGLNVNQRMDDFPSDIRQKAISVKMITGRDYDIPKFLTDFLKFFYKEYHQLFAKGFDFIVTEYQKFLAFARQKVEIHLPDRVIHGIQKGINPSGNLILSQNGKEIVITAGDLWQIKNGASDDSDH